MQIISDLNFLWKNLKIMNLLFSAWVFFNMESQKWGIVFGWALRFIIYWASKFYIDQIFDLEEKLNTFLGKVLGGVIEVCIEYQCEDPVWLEEDDFEWVIYCHERLLWRLAIDRFESYRCKPCHKPVSHCFCLVQSVF